MLFRFLNYTFEDEHDKYVGARYITGITVKENFDLFFNVLKNSKGIDIEIRDCWYTIDDIVFHYDGGEDDLFSCNVYCIGY